MWRNSTVLTALLLAAAPAEAQPAKPAPSAADAAKPTSSTPVRPPITSVRRDPTHLWPYADPGQPLSSPAASEGPTRPLVPIRPFVREDEVEWDFTFTDPPPRDPRFEPHSVVGVKGTVKF